MKPNGVLQVTSEEQPMQQVVFHPHLAVESWVSSPQPSSFSEYTGIPHPAKKQGIFSEALILSSTPPKPEQLCNSGAEIKLCKLCSTQHLNSEPHLQIQEYAGNNEASAVSSSEFKAICIKFRR